jgi:hypothetical protein
MSLRRTLTWALPAVAYAAFVRWYTDFGGPLDDDEIEMYLARFDALGTATWNSTESVAS